MDDPFDLTGKTALIVGGRGFLGQRFSQVLADAGAQVFSADLPQMSLAAAKDGTDNAVSDSITQKEVDVTDPISVSALVDGIMKDTGKIDILVYAVTAKPDDFCLPYTECSLEGWKTVLNAELDGAFLTTQRVGKVMEKQKNGSIILLSSIYGIVGNDQSIYEGSNLAGLWVGDENKEGKIYSHASYNAAKGGIITLSKYLAAYWGHLGIRVNTVSPGGVEHPAENETFVKKYSAKTPMGRKAKPHEIDGAILYLASDASSYATGTNIVVDGGWTTW
ncbi:MAG: SDR family oxidoreductase [Candidatus Peribacter sp.]|jgi:NAD(P)-dependent dehydrogenase (short-subunit alcohol dehydrogenase family)|nr:SDR family oxidoreductase [Candidatus Peribacter sp.]MBT4393179.1 SDR family oxidoreductase [Candidatus Peribacter sp.]MBT4600477.1 SDR family oxidoreductase [Candidatus Peribacter sp.]MBT5148547.1 SDR family oxidoreductase [Candidatus Peribacter sp.]MBT5937806.1 SDR family oxidoreductase [Candidatus Peribacter sp.]